MEPEIFEETKTDEVQLAPAKARPKDVKFNFLMVQIVLAALALLLVFALKFIGGDIFNYSKAVYKENFDKPINFEQVMNASALPVSAEPAPVTTTQKYGIGGERDDANIPFFESYDDAEKKLSENINDINAMLLPVEGRVTSDFGYRTHPVSGKKSMHTGVDIGGDMGEKILCALDGTVKKVVLNDSDYGNYIIVSHSGGVETMYGHCNKILAKKGDVVTKGTAIAEVGSTGISTGPHLHFEVRVNDVRLNPHWFVSL